MALGVWWLMWTWILARMLFRGERITDDHEWTSSRSWLPNRGGAGHGS